MISRNTAKTAIAIAEQFDQRKIALVATPGTPLAALVASSCLGEFAPVVNEPVYAPDPAYIEMQSTGYSAETPSQHNIELDAFKADISAAVTSHLNFAKNNVRPIIIELVTELEKDFNSIAVNYEYNTEIIQIAIPEPMNNNSFTQMVKEWSDKPYEQINTYLALPEQPIDAILTLLLTGSKDLDSVTKSWMAKRGEVFFQKVYNAVFTNTGTNESFNSLIQDADYGLDAAVAIFLMSTKLYDNPPEGTGYSLSNYNEKLADFRNQAAVRIGYGYEDFNRTAKFGTLIRKYTEGKNIYVNAEVYQKWISEGGSNAILFGSVLSVNTARTVHDLNENAAEFMKVWEQNNYLLTIAASNRRYITYKELTRDRLIRIVEQNLAKCFGVLTNGQPVTLDGSAVQQFKKLLDEYLDNTNDDDYKNLWSLALKLVCRTVFYYTDAEVILSGIEEATATNPAIHVREAALLSVIRYVTNYVCDQITVKGI